MIQSDLGQRRRDVVTADRYQPAIRDRIIGAATRLFAELGYDGTSTRMIADAAGLGTPVIASEIGSKRDLYLAVMERAHQSEQGVLEAAAAEFTPDRAGVERFVGSYLDFCVANPQIPALWMHRRLSDAADIAEMEKLYVLPAGLLGVETLRTVARPGVAVEFIVWTIVWCIHNFVAGGVLNLAGDRRGADDPQILAWFRTELSQSVARMLGME